VIATGRTMLATMIGALPLRARSRHQAAAITGDVSPVAAALWTRLTARRPSADDCRVLNAALVLLADHDIAASTLAARIAASTRAHPYAVVSAGLAALDGPFHGAASGLAYSLLHEAMTSGDPVGTIAGRLRNDGQIPGFGHALYADGDPRAATLLPMLGDGAAVESALRVADAVEERSGARPNIDLALAALALHYDMPPDAGEAIFAVARTAGWLAHALEEYASRPSRFRPVGVYSGRTP
jgi:citrate synthase